MSSVEIIFAALWDLNYIHSNFAFSLSNTNGIMCIFHVPRICSIAELEIYFKKIIATSQIVSSFSKLFSSSGHILLMWNIQQLRASISLVRHLSLASSWRTCLSISKFFLSYSIIDALWHFWVFWCSLWCRENHFKKPQFSCTSKILQTLTDV